MDSVDDEMPSTSFEEVGRGCRAKKKQTDPSICPVCCVTLRPQEIESHYMIELDKLGKVLNSKCKQNGKNCLSPSRLNGGAATENGNENAWDKYQKVKSNRQNRQKNKSRKRKHDHEEITCPVCNKVTSEDINVHVEKCLRRSEHNGSDSDENIDVEGYEEYEWAGESRVRATTMMAANLSNLGTSISRTEEDEDLVVDGDDTHLYGVPQYSEKDIILPGSIDKESDALRKAVLGVDAKKSAAKNTKESESEENLNTSGDPIVEALKSRIRDLESKDQSGEVYKCLICMERYRTPVISVCCWHVHCEICWLQTLGAKKLCPQCNMITSPSDLRRIYIKRK